MSLTQFAMVEELAFLIKDNLPCKHLILSMEEALVNFLQDDASSDGVLELEPMNSYSRLLLHRLADIFGFSHQSVGEGDDRHIVLERCPETSIPSILVSDLLWQYDEFQSPTMSNLLLRRKEASPELKAETPTFQFSLEEREAAYLAARERIFAVDKDETKGPVNQKPRRDPVVARRMIAHALGQRVESSNQAICLRGSKECGMETDAMNTKVKEEAATNSNLRTHEEREKLPGQNVYSNGMPHIGNHYSDASAHTEIKLSQKAADKTFIKVGISGEGRNERTVHKDNFKEEHMGAAKRIFSHALGFRSKRDGSLSKLQ